MKNPYRAKNPHNRNPFDFSDPLEVPRRPRPAPTRRNPYAMKPQTGGMDNLANGLVNVASLGIIAGTTVGILGAIQKSP